MPAIVAFFVRQFIIIAVQLGIFAAIDRFVTPLLNKAIKAIITTFNVDEATASDILANEIITTAESLGLTVALSRAKLPLKLAEKLGFTSKGFRLRKIAPAAQKKTGHVTGKVPAKRILGLSLGKGIITITGGLLAWNVLTDWVWIGASLSFLPSSDQSDIQKRALSIMQLINTPKSIIYSAEKARRQISQQERELIKETADEAERQIKDLHRIYSSKFVLFGRKDVLNQLENSYQALWLELQALKQMAGLIPRQPLVITKIEAKVIAVFDGDTVKLNNGEIVRLLGIDAPESVTEAGERSKAYLKTRLENQNVRIESDPNALNDMFGRRLGVIYLNDENINIEMIKKGYADFYEFEPNALVFKKVWKAAAKEGAPGAISLPQTKIFTGIVQQGTLGEAVGFTPREDDLIDSVDDLRTAAQNNLVQFMLAVPGRLIYEIKLVTSVITKDGTRRMGSTQRIVTRYTAAGKPRYKTVTNRFAIINIYIFTSRNVRSKIDTIVLGPTDAAKLQILGGALNDLSKAIRTELTTTNIAEIDTLVTAQPVTVTETPPTRPVTAPTTPPPAAAPAPQIVIPQYVQPGEGFAVPITDVKKYTDAKFTTRPHTSPNLIIVTPPAGFTPTQPTPAAPAVPPSNNPNKCSARTIAEFFDVNRATYPNVSARGLLYEAYGLGPAAWYTGTAEQNIKLLAELKRRSGC